MFGNRNGWILSAIILLVTGGLLWALYKRGTEPVAVGPIGMMAPRLTLTPPIAPRSVATWMTEDADATELYRQILADVKANEFAYKDFRGVANSPGYERVRKGLDLLIQARTHKKAAVFASTPDVLITNDLTLEPLRDHVRSLGVAALKHAIGLLNVGKVDESRQVFHAMFSLGVHLTEEKIIYEEWRQGNELLAVARYLKTEKLAESEEQRKRIEQFEEKFDAFRKQMVAPLHLFVLKYDPDPARSYAVDIPAQPSAPSMKAGFETWTADMIELARKSAEPTWRVEATMACGRARFQGLTNVDQRAAAAALRDLRGDKNPHVRKAAELGLALTKTDVERMQPHLVP